MNNKILTSIFDNINEQNLDITITYVHAAHSRINIKQIKFLMYKSA